MPEKPTRRRILIGPFDETASLPILGGGVYEMTSTNSSTALFLIVVSCTMVLLYNDYNLSG